MKGILMNTQVLRGYGAHAWLRKAALGLFTSLTLVSGVFAAPVTIVALGDSLTHGYGLPVEDGFVPQLEAWLQDNGAPDVIVKNAGVSGDTTRGGVERFEDDGIHPNKDGVAVLVSRFGPIALQLIERVEASRE